MNQKSTDISRRNFLKSGAIVAGSLVAIGAGVGIVKKVTGNDVRNKSFLRPPGAAPEKDFVYGCIKCGLCVQICPVHAIRLAGINKGLSYSTPYIDPRSQPCDFSCDSLQCVETCPTGVLDFRQFKHAGTQAIIAYEEERQAERQQQNDSLHGAGMHDGKGPHGADKGYNPFPIQIAAMKEAVRMGTAKLIPETCLAVQGIGFTGTPRGEDFKGVYRSPAPTTTAITGEESGDRPRRHQQRGNASDEQIYEKQASPLRNKTFARDICNLCVTECPIGEKAIVMSTEATADGTLHYSPQVQNGCTGCGVCVMVCPTAEASIIVLPNN
jgi:ferredoxin-type protein NapG